MGTSEREEWMCAEQVGSPGSGVNVRRCWTGFCLHWRGREGDALSKRGSYTRDWQPSRRGGHW